ncbi:OPT oligopeptide transporter protein-domain-containing protein [Phycomyces blakesleeanus]
MCFSNMYFGLQTGWISMMSLQSSLLGYAIFKPFQHRLRTRFGPIENVVLQTTAVATATMPLAAGFVGVIPALELLTTADNPDGPIRLSGLQLILWSLGVAFFGVFFAVPLRKQTIIKEKLRFPSGTATAQMISLLHQKQDPTKPKDTRLRRRRRTSAENVGPSNPEQNPLLSPVGSSSYSSASSTTSLTEVETAVQREAFETSWNLKLRALVMSFGLSSLYTLLTYFFPIVSALPVFNWITFNFVDFAAWEWYFTPSLSYVGQGIIMGLPTTLSMLLGCIIGWGILSPLAYYAGWAPGPVNDWKTGSKGWILWVSLGVMIADSVVSLGIVFIRSLVKAIRQNASKRPNQAPKSAYNRVSQSETQQCLSAEEHIEEEWEEADLNKIEEEEDDAPEEQRVSTTLTIIGLTLSTFMCVLLVKVVFGPDILPISMTLLSVIVAMILSVLGVRALGETDLNPVSGIGKISQVIFALIIPGGIAANLIAGGIAEAGAQQAGDLMQDLKTGHLLRASPKAQFYGQMIGSFFSAFVATGAYLLYRTVYSIPGPEFPVPTAQVWLDMSRLVNGHPLPPHVSEFAFGFAICFTAFVLIKETTANRTWHKYIPQGIAFAIGIYNPPSFTLARVIGGCVSHLWNVYCDKLDNVKEDNENLSWLDRHRRVAGKVLIVIVASGFVLGEGTFAIVNMTMRACNVPHL